MRRSFDAYIDQLRVRHEALGHAGRAADRDVETGLSPDAVASSAAEKAGDTTAGAEGR
jgi:hypothetical protein